MITVCAINLKNKKIKKIGNIVLEDHEKSTIHQSKAIFEAGNQLNMLNICLCKIKRLRHHQCTGCHFPNGEDSVPACRARSFVMNDAALCAASLRGHLRGDRRDFLD